VSRGGIALALGFAALTLTGCGAGTGGLVEAGDSARGKQLFQEKCASCHVLKDAGASGTVGPNLDAVFGADYSHGFEESTIRQVVADQIKYPGEYGEKGPTMPADLVKGDDVGAVATYVAAVAGGRSKGPVAAGTTTQQTTTGGTQTTGGGGQASAEGRQLFTTNCGGCHTLSDAGTSGKVGPDLDEISPTEAQINEQIHNGGGAMPPFKGILSEAQIETLAKYVFSARKK
jgi:mono/diheme cytochrome c family protein